MKNFVVLFLTFLTLTGAAFAQGEATEESNGGFDLFAPLDYDTYYEVDTHDDRAVRTLSENANIVLDILYPIMWARHAQNVPELHKKFIMEKEVIKGDKTGILSKEWKNLTKTRINDILKNVDRAGLAGSQRVTLIVEGKKFTNGKIKKAISGETVKKVLPEGDVKFSKGSTQLIFKDISKKELRNALSILSDNQVRVFKAGVGKARFNAVKILGSGVAIYLTVDLLDNVIFGH